MKQITIGLVDDHRIVRQGLYALLAMEEDFNVIGEAGNAEEGLALVERERPQIVLVDILMPGTSGLELVRQVSGRAPGTNTVVLSMIGSDSYVHQALRHGASGYVLKEAGISTLFEAIRVVAAGGRFLSPPLSDRSYESYLEPDDSGELAYDQLTDREREVFHLAADGLNNIAIANRLAISPRTVEIHRLNMMRKLKLRSQTELIRYALKRGAISLES